MEALELMGRRIEAIEVFKNADVLKGILGEIEKKALDFVPETATAKGRKEIGAQAYKVAQSKVMIDEAGKSLVSEWKQKAKEVDDSRKVARDFLDALKERVRKPLTDYEHEEKAREEAEKQAREMGEAEETAYTENALWEREQVVKKQEAARQAREEAERKAKEEAEKEERIRKAAEMKAQQEAEKKVKAAKEAQEMAERARIVAEERARIVERIMAESARREAREAVARAERDRQAKESAEKAARDKVAANAEHQAAVDMAIIKAIYPIVGEATADLMVALKAGKIPHLKIEY